MTIEAKFKMCHSFLLLSCKAKMQQLPIGFAGTVIHTCTLRLQLCNISDTLF